LFIGNPSDPTKPLANPVIWFTTPVVKEVRLRVFTRNQSMKFVV